MLLGLHYTIETGVKAAALGVLGFILLISTIYPIQEYSMRRIKDTVNDTINKADPNPCTEQKILDLSPLVFQLVILLIDRPLETGGG